MKKLSAILLFCCFVVLVHAQDNWTLFPQDVTSANLWSVAYGNGTLIAVGEQGTILTYDYNSPAWASSPSGTGVWLVGAGFGNGRFIVVGDQGTILTSDDAGVTWTPRASGTTTRLNAVCYGNGHWLVVGEQGTVLTSPDGSSWTALPALGSGFLRALAYGQGRFLIGGANGELFTTTDAATFTPVSIATAANIEGAAISDNHFWVVGSGGMHASATQLGTWTFATQPTTATYRGVCLRNPDEASAVGDNIADTFIVRPPSGAWASVFTPPHFLATAVTAGRNEVVCVGFGGNIAHSFANTPAYIVANSNPVIYRHDARFTFLTGTPVSSYQWTLNGANIPGATQATLVLPAVTNAQAGTIDVHFVTATGPGALYGYTFTVVPGGRPEVRDPNFTPALPSLPTVVAPQPDGKVLVAGTFTVTPAGGATYGLARLNADGSLDPAFQAGSGIPATTTVNAIHVLTDGRVYVRGSFSSIGGQLRNGLARLLPNGAIDPAFNPTDPALGYPSNSAVSASGQLYIQNAGSYYDGTVLRVAADGSRDATFTPIAHVRLVGVDAQGRVYAETNANGALSKLLRYLADGSVDATYTATPVSEGLLDDLAMPVVTPNGVYSGVASASRVGIFWSFLHILPNGGRDTGYQSPPANPFGGVGGFSFQWRPDGSLWTVTQSGTGYTASLYGPDGRKDPSAYAVLPDNSDYSMLALAPDNSIYAITNRYLNSTNTAFVRIRPITGQAGRLTNLSVRAFVPDGNNPLIAGFVTTGSGSTTALVRAVGPGLTTFGVPDAMIDPQLALVRDGTTVATNDNWDAALAPRFTAVGAFALTTGSKDAALEYGIDAGNYTSVVTPNSDSGTALVELYQSADPFTATRQFVNVSARGPVTSNRPLIVGFSISGDVPVTVLVRAAGPALTAFGVNNALADPQLTLFRSGTALWANDNWTTDLQTLNAVTAVGAFRFATNSKDSAMVVTLAPGSYTAVVNGANSTAGTSLVEVYQVP